jgi:hypothetical protein
MGNEVDGFLGRSMISVMVEHSLKSVSLNIPLKWVKRKAYVFFPYIMG